MKLRYQPQHAFVKCSTLTSRHSPCFTAKLLLQYLTDDSSAELFASLCGSYLPTLTFLPEHHRAALYRSPFRYYGRTQFSQGLNKRDSASLMHESSTFFDLMANFGRPAFWPAPDRSSPEASNNWTYKQTL